MIDVIRYSLVFVGLILTHTVDYIILRAP
jgi:hypothetical protein